MLKIKNYKLLFRYFKEDTFFNSNKKKKKINYKTNRKDIICEICTNSDNFLFKFISQKYSKIYLHKDVSKISGQIFIPISNINWIYEEELELVKATENFGFTNWESISQIIGTKNFVECEKHFLEIICPYLKKNFFEINRLFSKYKVNKIYYKNFRNVLKISNYKTKNKQEHDTNVLNEKFIIEQHCSKISLNNYFINIDKLNTKKTIKKQNSLFVLFNKISYVNARNKRGLFYNVKLTKKWYIPFNKNNKWKCEKKNDIFYNKLKAFKVETLNKIEKFNSLSREYYIEWLTFLIKFFFNIPKYHFWINNSFFKPNVSNIKYHKLINYRSIYNKKYKKSKIFNTIATKKDRLILMYFGLKFNLYISIYTKLIFDKLNCKEDKINILISSNYPVFFCLFEQFLIDININT
nr:hypothetical protein Cry52Nrm1_p005 [Cryptomonas curvata]